MWFPRHRIQQFFSVQRLRPLFFMGGRSGFFARSPPPLAIWSDLLYNNMSRFVNMEVRACPGLRPGRGSRMH